LAILRGRYLVGRVIGVGGFGITYAGLELDSNARVAIKEYFPAHISSRAGGLVARPSSAGDLEEFTAGWDRFVAESEALKKYSRLPGIVSFVEYFQENGTAYIVMEHIDGLTLKAMLDKKKSGALPIGDVLKYLKPVMAALHAIHAGGLIHRDISPDNIMVAKSGESKLIDFGASIPLGAPAKDENDASMLLKHGFAPEEQYQSLDKQGPWTDVYALCATIYRAITGIRPDDARDRAIHDSLVPPSRLGVSISAEQEQILMLGLAVVRHSRFQSVAEIYATLYGEVLPPAGALAAARAAPGGRAAAGPAGERGAGAAPGGRATGRRGGKDESGGEGRGEGKGEVEGEAPETQDSVWNNLPALMLWAIAIGGALTILFIIIAIASSLR
jgi:serine/threonine protein kinase